MRSPPPGMQVEVEHDGVRVRMPKNRVPALLVTLFAGLGAGAGTFLTLGQPHLGLPLTVLSLLLAVLVGGASLRQMDEIVMTDRYVQRTVRSLSTTVQRLDSAAIRHVGIHEAREDYSLPYLLIKQDADQWLKIEARQDQLEYLADAWQEVNATRLRREGVEGRELSIDRKVPDELSKLRE